MAESVHFALSRMVTRPKRPREAVATASLQTGPDLPTPYVVSVGVFTRRLIAFTNHAI